MFNLREHTATIRSSRMGRGFVWALILHVIALFSFMPFGQPVVASPFRAAGIPTASAQVQIRVSTDVPGEQSIGTQQGDGDTASGSAAGAHQVFANRSQAESDPVGLPSFEYSLFAGLRACASLRPSRARRVALAAQYRLRLRAPPSVG